MRKRYLAGAVIAIVAAISLTAPVAAQNRAETQLLLELRSLQEQVQKMQIAVNQLAEKLKTAESRVDAQSNDTRKGFADQKVLIDAISSGLRTLNERENESAVRVAQFSQEMKAIREGLTSQQTSLSEIADLLRPLSAAAFAAAAATSTPTDPATAGGVTGTPVQPPPGVTKPALPPNPTAYYGSAFGYYHGGQWESAVTALGAAIQKFPEHPDAARAQFFIGEAYFLWGKHYEEALAAYTAVVTNYKGPEDVVSDSLYKQGVTYEQLGKKDNAIRSYQQVIKLYKGTSAEILATTALRKLIK